MDFIIEFTITNAVGIIATAILSAGSFLAGHVFGYIKRKADEPQLDVYDVVQAVIDEIKEKDE